MTDHQILDPNECVDIYNLHADNETVNPDGLNWKQITFFADNKPYIFMSDTFNDDNPWHVYSKIPESLNKVAEKAMAGEYGGKKEMREKIKRMGYNWESVKTVMDSLPKKRIKASHIIITLIAAGLVLLMTFAVAYASSSITYPSEIVETIDIQRTVPEHESEPEYECTYFTEPTVPDIARPQKRPSVNAISIEESDACEVNEHTCYSDSLYSDWEVDLVAKVVCLEEGAGSQWAREMVASVIRNRVYSDSPWFPDSYYDVIYQAGQFGCTDSYGNWVRDPFWPDWADYDIRSACYAAAEKIMCGNTICPDNVVYEALFEQGSGVYAVSDNGTYFCYE